jgi:hypothetical protein
MAIRRLLGVAGAFEAITGLALVIYPSLVVRLLFGAEIFGAGNIAGPGDQTASLSARLTRGCMGRVRPATPGRQVKWCVVLRVIATKLTQGIF